MTKASKHTIRQAREDLMKALATVTAVLPIHRSREIDAAWAQIETFCAISLRVMAKTNMSKLISETNTVELSARLADRMVFDPD